MDAGNTFVSQLLKANPPQPSAGLADELRVMVLAEGRCSRLFLRLVIERRRYGWTCWLLLTALLSQPPLGLPVVSDLMETEFAHN